MDTIALRGPAHPSVMGQLTDRHFRQQYDDMTGELIDILRSGSASVQVGATRVRLYADQRLGFPEVRMEFSVPTMLDGHNRDPTWLVELPVAVEVALDKISSEISGMPSLDQLRPIRLDVARNFQRVESPSRTLTAISKLPVQRASADRVYGRVQTLMRGNTARWAIRGYDKYEQMLDLARTQPSRRDLLLTAAQGMEGLLRVEVELKSPFLRERGINRVDDIKVDDMHAVAEQFFDKARFGAVIGCSTRLRDVMTSLTDTEARGVSALLLAEFGGYEPPLSRNPLATYRALTRRLGLTVADLTDGETEPRRLDFASGTEMLGAEATKLDQAV